MTIGLYWKIILLYNKYRK